MIDIRRNYGGSLRDFASNHLHIAVLTQGNVTHLRCDDSLPCIMHLRHGASGTRPNWHWGAALPLLEGRPASHGSVTVISHTHATRCVGFCVSVCGDLLLPLRFHTFVCHTDWSHCPIDLQMLIGRSIRCISLVDFR